MFGIFSILTKSFLPLVSFDKTMRLDSVLLATFSTYKDSKRTLTGNLLPLLNFFVPRSQRVVLIDQPHPMSTELKVVVEEYEDQKLKHKYFLDSVFYQLLDWWCQLENKSDETKISFKIRDFLSVLYLGSKEKEKISLLIGLESINALAGILLKKLGKVETVVYYVSDFSPDRYHNKIFNAIYLWLDRLAAYHSDFIWDVSPAMHPARIKAGLDRKKSAPVIRVANAIAADDKVFLSMKQIKLDHLVYMGTLGVDNGSDVAIKALPLVLKKFPKACLHIIGGGNPAFFKRLKNLAKSLRVRSRVKFHGFILSDKKMLKTMSRFYLAVAPYRDIPESCRFYGDSTKIRAYLSVGLPVITTKVPPLAREIIRAKAGIIVDDNEKELAREIIKLFKNKKLYQKYRQSAIKFAKENTWEKSFNQALKKMGMKNVQKN